MAEEFLDDAEVGSVFEEMSREGVAEEVRVDLLVDPSLLGAGFDDLADAVRAEGAAADGEEDVAGGFGAH